MRTRISMTCSCSIGQYNLWIGIGRGLCPSRCVDSILRGRIPLGPIHRRSLVDGNRNLYVAMPTWSCVVGSWSWNLWRGLVREPDGLLRAMCILLMVPFLGLLPIVVP